VAANGNHQAQNLDREAADYEHTTLRRFPEQRQRGEREKEPGWHYQQSGIFHSLFLSGFHSM
jgi:hypothetical protein